MDRQFAMDLRKALRCTSGRGVLCLLFKGLLFTVQR